MTQSEATQRSSGQAAGKDAIRPFHVSIPEEALVDLRRRIAATRWPRPTTAGWGPDHIARAWVVLMKRLGHTQFVSQGGDVGAVVSDVMAGNGKVTLINSPSENYCRREAESKACWL